MAEAPVSARDDPRAYSEILDMLAPGTTIHRKVEVSNPVGVAQEVTLSCTAADITSGRFVGGPAGDRNDLCDWTSLDPAGLTLAAQAKSDATVSISVPKDAGPGERYSVVWASVAQTDASGLTRVTRVGVRLYVYVGGSNPPPTDFSVGDLAVTRVADLPVVSARITDTGGRAIDLSGELRLTDGPGSLSAGPFPIDSGVTLSPGQTGQVQAPTSASLPAGRWTATLTVRSGTVTRAATPAIVVPAASGATSSVPLAPTSGAVPTSTAQPPSGDRPAWLVWTLVVVGLALVLAGGLWFLLRRRTHPGRP